MLKREVLHGHENTVSAFYGSFPYPWRPMYFDSMSDPGFFTTFLRQETGRPQLPEIRDVWVAGCGTNQALITALKYPQAQVLGTDVSAESLQICADNAEKLGVTNLRLEQQGLTQGTWDRAFDLVICTGVIHHNPDPQLCLARLAAGLRLDGVLELMVYNMFHRRETSAFQAALRLLVPEDSGPYRDRLNSARALSSSITVPSRLTEVLARTANSPEPSWADRWMNPCERSYDVDSLWDLATSCGLTLEAPHANAFDKVENTFLWTMSGLDPALQERFVELDDRSRWQVVNLLQLDASPKLWFYLRHQDFGERVTEKERNEVFLDSVLQRSTAVRHRHVLTSDGSYQRDPVASPVRDWLPFAEVKAVWAAADGRTRTRDLLTGLSLGLDFTTVLKARVMLTSAEFPHLVARPDT